MDTVLAMVTAISFQTRIVHCVERYKVRESVRESNKCLLETGTSLSIAAFRDLPADLHKRVILLLLVDKHEALYVVPFLGDIALVQSHSKLVQLDLLSDIAVLEYETSILSVKLARG